MRKFKKFKPLLIAIIAILCLCTTSQAQISKPVFTVAINADYVRALFTADKFLSAWKTRNVAEGLTLVSGAIKGKISHDLKSSPLPAHQKQRVGEKIDVGVKSINCFLSCAIAAIASSCCIS